MGIRRRTTFSGRLLSSASAISTSCLAYVAREPRSSATNSSEMVEYRGHMRLIRTADPAAREVLTSEGLIELRSEQWLRAPRLSSPHELVSRYGDASGRGGQSEQHRGIADPGSERGCAVLPRRWREPQERDEGRFLARRPQAFGAPLWCWSEFADGELTALIDLPIQSPLARGCDEAWHLQAALDATSEHPQHLRVREAPSTPGAVLIDLFSPLPSWAQRRLEVIATSVARSAGALVTYQLSKDDLEKEANFLKDMMWLVNEEELSSDAPNGNPATLGDSVASIRAALQDYIEATYHIGHPSLVAQRRALLDQEGVSSAPHTSRAPRATGPAAAFADLEIPDDGQGAVRRMAHPSDGQEALLHDPPYTHQAGALEATIAGRAESGGHDRHRLRKDRVVPAADPRQARDRGTANPAAFASAGRPGAAAVPDERAGQRPTRQAALAVRRPACRGAVHGLGRPAGAVCALHEPDPVSRRAHREEGSATSKSIETFYIAVLEQAADEQSPSP